MARVSKEECPQVAWHDKYRKSADAPRCLPCSVARDLDTCSTKMYRSTFMQHARLSWEALKMGALRFHTTLAC